MGVLLEGILAWMLEDEDAVLGKHVTLEDKVRKRCKALDGVGRVGKYYVELAVGSFQKVENVGTYHVQVLYPHTAALGLDVVGALGVDVDARHLAHTA